jgi:hypothetical protein
MEEARRWYSLRPRELPPREKAFLEAVFALARRGKRLKRFALTSAFVVLGVVAAGASVALVQIRSAEKEASAQAELAKSREKTTADALAGMKQKEAERLAAEAKQKEAEQQKLAVEEQKLAVEKDKAKAELDKVKAEQEKAQADVQVAQTNEQLQAKVKELYAQKAKMEQTNIALEKTKKELQALSSSQASEIARLKEEQRKLTTKLK